MNYRRILPAVAILPSLLGASFAFAQEIAAEVAHDTAQQGSGGLPQLDTATFPSQVFWLLVTGLATYTIMSKLALPKIQGIMHARDHFVHDHLRQAAEIRNKAEDAKINYDVALRQAETKAKDVIADTTAALRKKHDQAMQDALQKIQTETDAVEARLHAEKQQIMQSVDQRAAQLADEIMTTVFAGARTSKKGQVA